jgi:hypothetical protein
MSEITTFDDDVKIQNVSTEVLYLQDKAQVDMCKVSLGY